MFDEDNPNEFIRNSSERILLIQLACLGVFAGWAVAGNCSWAPGFIAAIGFFGPVLLLIHNSQTVTGNTFSKLKYLAITLPVWITILVLGFSYFQPLLQEASFAPDDFFFLENGDPLKPGYLLSVSWVSSLMLCGIYMAALNLLIVPETRLSLRMLIRALSISAILLTAVGWIGWVLDLKEILFFITPPTSDFFSLFPSASHWCSFALLWIAALGGLCATNIPNRSWHFFLAESTFPLCSIVVLGSSVVLLGTPLQLFILGALTACTLLVCAVQSARQKQNPQWVAVFLGILGILLLIGGIIACAITSAKTPDLLANLRGTAGAPDWQTRQLIWNCAWEAFSLRPLWGWGPDSFGAVLSFFQNAELGSQFYGVACSDLLQSLVEKGALLTLLWIVFPLYFLLRFFKRLKNCAFCITPLLGCGLLAFSAIIDMPFQSPAVLVSWFLIFFAAIQWARLEAHANRPRKTAKPLLKRNVPILRKG